MGFDHLGDDERRAANDASENLWPGSQLPAPSYSTGFASRSASRRSRPRAVGTSSRSFVPCPELGRGQQALFARRHTADDPLRLSWRLHGSGGLMMISGPPARAPTAGGAYNSSSGGGCVAMWGRAVRFPATSAERWRGVGTRYGPRCERPSAYCWDAPLMGNSRGTRTAGVLSCCVPLFLLPFFHNA